MKAIHIILGAPKREDIAPLIKEEGFVLGVDRGALFALEEGINLDIALGDFDSITAEEEERINKEAEVMIHDSSVEDTDTEVALLYVLENYEDADIYLHNWYGGRIDHLYSILLVAVQKRFEKITSKLHLISNNNFISYYSSGEYEINQINNMDYLSFVLLTEVKDLTLNGVKYPLENKSFDHPLALVSNEFINGKASFSFKKGIVAAIQSRD